jgi:hypothetical protein
MDWTEVGKNKVRWRTSVNAVFFFLSLLYTDAISVERLYSVDDRMINECAIIYFISVLINTSLNKRTIYSDPYYKNRYTWRYPRVAEACFINGVNK